MTALRLGNLVPQVINPLGIVPDAHLDLAKGCLREKPHQPEADA